MKTITVYKRLLARYGPQGWWPTSADGQRKAAYEPGRTRRPSAREAFEICVGAILTQNTSWTNVERAVENLRSACLLEPVALAGAPAANVRACVRPAGYYNQKTTYLQGFAKHVFRHYNGDLALMLAAPTEKLRCELLSLVGIGPETADSILLYAAQRPVFAVDAYTKRIASRVGLLPVEECRNYEGVRAFFERTAPAGFGRYGEFHALLVKHAKEHCAKNAPACGGCPLARECVFRKNTVAVGANGKRKVGGAPKGEGIASG